MTNDYLSKRNLLGRVSVSSVGSLVSSGKYMASSDMSDIEFYRGH